MTDKDLEAIPPIELEAEVIPAPMPDVLFALNISPVNKQKINSVEPPENTTFDPEDGKKLK